MFQFHKRRSFWWAQLFLIIILCCWLSRCFCNENIHKKTMFCKCFFYKKTFKKTWLMKVDTEAKFMNHCNLWDIASLCINLSLKTVLLSPPIFGQFCEKLIICFPPEYLGLPVLTKYFVKKKIFVYLCFWRQSVFKLVGIVYRKELHLAKKQPE